MSKQNAKVFYVTAGGIYVYQLALKDYEGGTGTYYMIREISAKG